MEKKLKLLPPSMPNFISFEQLPGLRQDGFKRFGKGLKIGGIAHDPPFTTKLQILLIFGGGLDNSEFDKIA